MVATALVHFLLSSGVSSIGGPGSSPSRKYCQRGDSSCWPTAADVATLAASLDPSASRTINYHKGDATLPAPVPMGASAPLFGFGAKGMPPVVTAPTATGPCFVGKASAETRPTCLASTRDNPARWGPAFVVFPLVADHVVTTVNFARKHNLCVSVLGTGHDFLNRHDGCPDGLLIRTTLMKEMNWDLDDAKGFGWKDGNVRLGTGLTFSEIGASASKNGRLLAEGWTHTVGVAGWSIGGGHGPFANWAGLGIDNVLEAELVTADGSLITANATHNSDMYQALRGGGGSAWGVLTSLTLRAHAIPAGGFHLRTASWVGDSCLKSARLHQLIDAYLAWTLTLDTTWNGLVWILPVANKVTCGSSWVFELQYYVSGTVEDSEATWQKLVDAVKKKPLHSNATQMQIETDTHANDIPIEVTPYMAPHNNTIGGVPSVMVSRENTANGKLGTVLKKMIGACNAREEGSKCEDIQIYQDITGNIGAKQAKDVSITKSFREALFHIISGSGGGWSEEQFESYYSLGDGSYFGESAIVMEGFKERLWGDNYDRLLKTKQKYDPNNFFWCRHCVGSDL